MAKRPFSKKAAIGMDVSAAFHFYVDKTADCWLWTGPIFRHRGCYGCFTMRRAGYVQARAHRVSWELHQGPLRPEQHVLHSCDNPLCVNPNHLFLGDQSSNMKDKVAKNRQNRGHTHGRRKLTESQAIAIRDDKRPQSVIAKEYGISVATVSNIQCGYSWKHLGKPSRRYKRAA